MYFDFGWKIDFSIKVATIYIFDSDLVWRERLIIIIIKD